MRVLRIGIFVVVVIIIIIIIMKSNNESYKSHPLNYAYQLTNGYAPPNTKLQNENKSKFLIQKENYDTCNSHCN